MSCLALQDNQEEDARKAYPFFANTSRCLYPATGSSNKLTVASW
jgi:hypothetical protein